MPSAVWVGHCSEPPPTSLLETHELVRSTVATCVLRDNPLNDNGMWYGRTMDLGRRDMLNHDVILRCNESWQNGRLIRTMYHYNITNK